jgi:DNA-binding response OmpR family regulator
MAESQAGGYRVLVVDSKQYVRRLLESHLRAAGYDVLCAGDGREALRLAEARTPDVILLEVMLPHVDGYAVCQTLRAKPRFHKTLIVFLTVSDTLEDKTRGLECGANDYLTKPFAMTELLLRVRNHLTYLSDLPDLHRGTLLASVFLSYSHNDRDFAHRLADDLRILGHHIWIDEFEIRIGDSLIEKISTAISEVDFVLAILSQESVRSSWVQHELKLAATTEISKRRVVVLPVVLQDDSIPAFLSDKRWADFRKPENYEASVRILVESIDRHRREARRSAEDSPTRG